MSEERVESARKYREAVEAYLGGPKVEAAGKFQRYQGIGNDIENLFLLFRWLSERLTKGSIGRIQGKFLLAVTSDKVHAFKYRQRGSNLDVKEEIAVFSRDDIRLRSTPGGLGLCGTEHGRTHHIALDGSVLNRDQGAAEVLAALSE